INEARDFSIDIESEFLGHVQLEDRIPAAESRRMRTSAGVRSGGGRSSEPGVRSGGGRGSEPGGRGGGWGGGGGVLGVGVRMGGEGRGGGEGYTGARAWGRRNGPGGPGRGGGPLAARASGPSYCIGGAQGSAAISAESGRNVCCDNAESAS